MPLLWLDFPSSLFPAPSACFLVESCCCRSFPLPSYCMTWLFHLAVYHKEQKTSQVKQVCFLLLRIFVTYHISQKGFSTFFLSTFERAN